MSNPARYSHLCLFALFQEYVEFIKMFYGSSQPYSFKFFQKIKIDFQLLKRCRNPWRFETPEFELNCTKSDALHKKWYSHNKHIFPCYGVIKNTFSISICTVAMKNLIKFHNIFLNFAKLHNTKFDLAFRTLKILYECLETSGHPGNLFGIYLFKVKHRNTKKCAKCFQSVQSFIKTPEQPQWRRSSVFIINFEHISFLFLLFLLLILSR